MADINYYSYKELLAEATKSNATQEDINALGEWFDRFGDYSRDWNGEAWNTEDSGSATKERLYPIYKVDKHGDVDEDDPFPVGYTFSSDPEDRIRRPEEVI